MLGELAQQVPRGVIEFGRYINDEVHEEITTTTAVQMLDALVADAMDRATSAARLDLDGDTPSKGRCFDGRPEYGLGKGNVRLVVQVVAVTLKTIVRFHVQMHE